MSVDKSYTYDDGCESCGTDTFNREPFVVMFSSKYTGRLISLFGHHYTSDVEGGLDPEVCWLTCLKLNS